MMRSLQDISKTQERRLMSYIKFLFAFVLILLFGYMIDKTYSNGNSLLEPTADTLGVLGTSRYECITALERLRVSLLSRNPVEAFRLSISMVDKAVPRFAPYICRDPTKYSEYVSYGDESTCMDTNSIVLNYMWSYRLAIFQYHLNFFRWIADPELQKRLLMTQTKGTPDCYNPVEHYNVSQLVAIELHLRKLGEDSLSQFTSSALSNIDFHLSMGLYRNPLCRFALSSGLLNSPSDFLPCTYHFTLPFKSIEDYSPRK